MKETIIKSIEEHSEDLARRYGYPSGFKYLCEHNKDLGHSIELKATKAFYEEKLALHSVEIKPINLLIRKVHANAVAKGFYDAEQPQNVGEKLMLIVSEISEALEADRKGKHAKYMINSSENQDLFGIDFRMHIKDTFEDELADAVIRIFDLCGWLNIDLESHIILKMRYNAGREKLHGKKY